MCFGEEKFLRHMDLDFTGQVAEDSLGLVEHLDQVALAAIIVAVDAQPVDELIQFCELGNCCFRQVFATH